MENIKLLATFEFIAILIFIIGWGNDVYHRHDYSSEDGGWTITYYYNKKARSFAYKLSYLSGIVSVAGVLIAIWI